MTRKSIGILAVAAVVCSVSSNAEESFRPLKGPYMGQEAGEAPRIFLPGKISTGNDEGCSVFFPGARSFLWGVTRGKQDLLLLLEDVQGRWQPPRQVAPAGDRGVLRDFTLSADGEQLYFTSDMPLENAARGNLWSVRLGPVGGSEPRSLGPSINTDWDESYPSLTRDGVLYFSRGDPEDASSRDIYFAEPEEGGFSVPHRVPPPVNSEFPDYDPLIAADGTFLIFTSRRPGGHGQGDLYISYRGARGQWSEPLNLGPRINGPAEENRPSVTLDGNYFFFNSNRQTELQLPPGIPPASSMPGQGSRDIYWMKADFIRALRSNAPGNE